MPAPRHDPFRPHRAKTEDLAATKPRPSSSTTAWCNLPRKANKKQIHRQKRSEYGTHRHTKKKKSERHYTTQKGFGSQLRVTKIAPSLQAKVALSHLPVQHRYRPSSPSRKTVPTLQRAQARGPERRRPADTQPPPLARSKCRRQPRVAVAAALPAWVCPTLSTRVVAFDSRVDDGGSRGGSRRSATRANTSSMTRGESYDVPGSKKTQNMRLTS